MYKQSNKATWPRMIAGFVLAPLIVPISYFVFGLAAGRQYGAAEFAGTLLNFGPYVYCFALLLGAPAVLLLRRSHGAGLWTYCVVAGAIGLLGSAMFLMFGLKVEGVIIGALSGALAGAAFYVLVFR